MWGTAIGEDVVLAGVNRHKQGALKAFADKDLAEISSAGFQRQSPSFSDCLAFRRILLGLGTVAEEPRNEWKTLAFVWGLVSIMPLWQLLVLAVVQGVAEFLPISSSGHIVVLGGLMEVPELAELNIVLHLGSLGSILVFYRERILQLLSVDRRVNVMLILATIPAVVIGLTLKKYAEFILESPLVAGVMFPITGLAVLSLSRKPDPNAVEYSSINWKQALAIGFSQAAAILPGLSRSGSTISSGVGVGLTRSSAAAFSFLMAIPVIAGAGVLESKDWFTGEKQWGTPPWQLALGAFVAFVVGIGTLQLLSRWLAKGQMAFFGWYCIVLGFVVVAWQLSLLGSS